MTHSHSLDLLSRSAFKTQARDRDDDTCIVPWCDDPVDDIHHIIERSLWSDGEYYLENAASVCNPHHKTAEQTLIPPHAFWRWADVTPVTPDGYSTAITKWGDSLDTPPWEQHRDFHKYPSSRHFPFSHSRDNDDTQHREVDSFIDTPLVVTTKMDRCLPYRQEIPTEHNGVIDIGTIVNQELDVNVLSYNFETGEQEYRPVTNY